MPPHSARCTHIRMNNDTLTCQHRAGSHTSLCPPPAYTHTPHWRPSPSSTPALPATLPLQLQHDAQSAMRSVCTQSTCCSRSTATMEAYASCLCVSSTITPARTSARSSRSWQPLARPRRVAAPKPGKRERPAASACRGAACALSCVRNNMCVIVLHVCIRSCTCLDAGVEWVVQGGAGCRLRFQGLGFRTQQPHHLPVPCCWCAPEQLQQQGPTNTTSW